MDYILKGGIIVDGTRSKPYKAALVIRDGIIKDITSDEANYEGNTIDVKGKIISPGFIDIHTHSDICYLLPYTPVSKIYQGITTEIVGNCGVSVIPITKESQKATTDYFNGILEVKSTKALTSKDMAEYTKELNNSKLPVNLGVLIGHGTLRGTVVGFDDRRPTTEEMDKMCGMLDYELKNGAFGLSLGLIYPPGNFSDTRELIRLAEILKDNGDILTVHMRNEGNRIFEALDEMLYVARKTGVHLHISHLKLIGKKQWGKSDILLKKIDGARQNGLNITCDQYPYNATSTSLSALVPGWAHGGGTERMLERLVKQNPGLDNDIQSEMENRGGPGCISISGTKGYMTEAEGRNIQQISKLLNLNPVDAIKKVLINTKGNAAAVYHSLNLDDVINIMQKMYISVGSDGYAFSYDPQYTTTNPHPRSFGTFPKFFQMVRENNVMPIEDAVYKVTKLAADTLGITDRGMLLPGKIADITVFDPEKIKDNSTFKNSVAKPSGIEHVFVNGQPVLLYGDIKITGNGKVILKK